MAVRGSFLSLGGKKMATFYNQASLSIGGKVTNSNITEGEVLTQVTMIKTPLTTDYGPEDNLVYAVTITNNSASTVNDITITDDLGAFTFGALNIVPLTYVIGTAVYYLNGVLQQAPTVIAGPPLTISGINIPAGGVAMVIYETRANEFAPLDENAFIRNTVTATGEPVCEDLSATADVPTRDEPHLTISKAICPETITCGGEVTYTFIIQNTGNIPIVATDNLIVTDVFNPALSNITVKLNGEILTEGVEYSYNTATGEFATLNGAITVPAATFTRDTETGIITTTPGVAIITVTGNV